MQQGLARLRAYWQRGLLNKAIILLVPLTCCCCALGARQGSAPASAPASVVLAPTAEPVATEAPAATPPRQATIEQLQTAAAALPSATVAVPTEAATVAPSAVPVVIAAEPVPLTIEGLTPLLIQNGDLPAGWTGAEVYDESPVDYDGPAPVVVVNQGLLATPTDRVPSGRVVLWVFASADEARAAFNSRSVLVQSAVDADADRQSPSIGDEALLIPGHGDVFITNQLVFIRCRAVVEIDQGLAAEVDQIITFANRIDQRIRSSACS